MRIGKRVVAFHFVFHIFQSPIYQTKYVFKNSNIGSTLSGNTIYHNVLGLDVQINFHLKNYKPSPPPELTS